MVQSIHFSHIRSNLVPFGPFCPLRSYLVHSLLFSPIWYTLFLFNPFDPILSILSTLFHLVQFGPFKSLRFFYKIRTHVWHILLIFQTLSECLDSRFSITFAFFFFFQRMNNNRNVHAHGFIVQETKGIVHALFMGPAILFIHLKIILLQYFQFSIFTKISYIQTNPK